MYFEALTIWYFILIFNSDDNTINLEQERRLMDRNKRDQNR